MQTAFLLCKLRAWYIGCCFTCDFGGGLRKIQVLSPIITFLFSSLVHLLSVFNSFSIFQKLLKCLFLFFAISVFHSYDFILLFVEFVIILIASSKRRMQSFSVFSKVKALGYGRKIGKGESSLDYFHFVVMTVLFHCWPKVTHIQYDY